jgi:3-deoxy-manno-octulosonate cytidylyltransferase (CMP-KDO synthetase)
MTNSSHESGTDRIFEVATSLNWSSEDIVINVQGNEPLISSERIKQFAQFNKERSEFSITTVVSKIKYVEDFKNPNIVKGIIGANDRALYFTRSASPFNRDNISDFSLAYKHVGIYAYKVKALSDFCSYKEAPLESCEKLEQLRALSFGMTIGAYYFDGEIAHGVDTLDDYQSMKIKIEEGK